MNEIQADYYDAVAGTYDDFSGSLLHQAEDLVLARQLQALVKDGNQPIQAVLDLACGTGLGYTLAKEHLPLSERPLYYGFDISEGMLKVCRRKELADGSFDMNLRQADINQLKPDDIPDNIDLVLMGFGSFSYVESPVHFLSTVMAKLRPKNGHVLVMAYSQLSRRNQALARTHDDPSYLKVSRPYQFRDDQSGIPAPSAHFYQHPELTRIAVNAGFRNLRVVGMNFNTVKESDCESVEDGIARLEHEMATEPNPNDAHALILSAKNY